ncbi:transporter substrate-binding domain-containing protein [Aquabacterium sp. A7-Y]|nr:transporter substrate-binding domain-containing protein [Aquabacterium sp. A7-Y]
MLCTSAATPYAQSSSAQPVLKVLVLKDSPSMSYRDDKGALVGFNVDLAHGLCEQMKARCEIEETLLSTVIDQVAQGYADFSTAALAPTDERLKKVRFTEAVSNSVSYWFSRRSLAESKKFRVAAVAGSAQQQWAERTGRDLEWALLPVKTNADVSQAMLEGRADAGVFPFASTLSLVHEGKLGRAGFSVLEPLGGLTPGRNTAIAVDPSQPKLLESLNQALRALKSSGRLEELNSKHFPMRML